MFPQPGTLLIHLETRDSYGAEVELLLIFPHDAFENVWKLTTPFV